MSSPDVGQRELPLASMVVTESPEFVLYLPEHGAALALMLSGLAATTAIARIGNDRQPD